MNFNQTIIDDFRAHDGVVTVGTFGDRLLLVHHTGAKSGTERVTPIAAFPQDDGSWLIAATYAGNEKDPAWYGNLLAHPRTTVEAPHRGEVPVDVTELTGAERDVAWSEMTTAMPGFLDYEKKTDRVFPVLRLTPVA